MSQYMLPTVPAIEELLRSHYPPVDRKLAARVLEYLTLLAKWDAKLNLTSESAVGAVRRHFGESFFATTLLPLERGTLVDVGSGAGFPGLALKLIRPELDVVLLEPNRKKCAFLAEVARTLALKNVRIIARRTEEAGLEAASSDYITFRAVGQHMKLLDWAQCALKKDGKLIAWIGEEGADLLASEPGWKLEAKAAIPFQSHSFVVTLSPRSVPSE
jgi:16S rRNA (guanine527-N7)-methyltransferase